MSTRDLLSADATALSLADFSSEKLIVPRLHEKDPAGVIAELSQALLRESCVPDLLLFYNAVVNREFLTSTCMEPSMAFPHARVAGVKELCFALGRTPEPIVWGTPAIRMVQLIFLIAVPATDATEYLHLISGLARLGKERQFYSDLLQAQDAPQIFRILRQVKLRPGR